MLCLPTLHNKISRIGHADVEKGLDRAAFWKAQCPICSCVACCKHQSSLAKLQSGRRAETSQSLRSHSWDEVGHLLICAILCMNCAEMRMLKALDCCRPGRQRTYPNNQCKSPRTILVLYQRSFKPALQECSSPPVHLSPQMLL